MCGRGSPAPPSADRGHMSTLRAVEGPRGNNYFRFIAFRRFLAVVLQCSIISTKRVILRSGSWQELNNFFNLLLKYLLLLGPNVNNVRRLDVNSWTEKCKTV